MEWRVEVRMSMILLFLTLYNFGLWALVDNFGFVQSNGTRNLFLGNVALNNEKYDRVGEG